MQRADILFVLHRYCVSFNMPRLDLEAQVCSAVDGSRACRNCVRLAIWGANKEGDISGNPIEIDGCSRLRTWDSGASPTTIAFVLEDVKLF
jgi:hypothetical protein